MLKLSDMTSNPFKKALVLTGLAVIAALCSSCRETGAKLAQNEPVPFYKVKINDDFWQPRIKALSEVTIPFCLDQCCHQTGRVDNFAIAAGAMEGEWKGIFYDDSDLYKTLEGAAYSLRNNPDPVLEAQVDSIIALIAGAQQDDGYINTYYTLKKPDGRWTDTDKHEMYCGGHLIEAGIAYYGATGKRTLLDVGQRFADYLIVNFNPEGRHWVAGHPEIELALVKLYRETGDRKYLDEAHFLIEERGHGHATWDSTSNAYYLDGVPAASLEKISGHAVRGMYLLTGMADWSAQSGSTQYLPALDRIWDNVVGANMYITGGIGSSRHNEGFTTDYDLPNKEAYCETCASVGMVLWNQRMNMLKGQAVYADVLERALYNGALAGISLSSDRFFYVNPLASDGDHHRQPWYGTACCPSQISRFMPSVGGYIYATSEDALWINLFISSSTEIKLGRRKVGIEQATAYPWDGNIGITVNPERTCRFTMKIRIPGWCKSYSIMLNDTEVSADIHDGYAVIDRKWSAGDKISLRLDMPVETVAADPRVEADKDRRAIQRGPLVYCLEEVDNQRLSKEPVLDGNAVFTTAFDPDLLNGVTTITARQSTGTLKFIPYYAWDNREPGRMEVWVKYQF